VADEGHLENQREKSLVKLDLGMAEVRSWRLEDADSLVRHANNRKVWLQLRDVFPHPYTSRDAEEFLTRIVGERPETNLAIAVGEEAVGGIGLRLQTDVERCSAELGYWLGEEFWGRGITTAAVRAVTRLAIETFELTRIGESRVLQSAGEGRIRSRGEDASERNQGRKGPRQVPVRLLPLSGCPSNGLSGNVPD
jgi:RimJ/RimL family protein N-acetyltransferase